MDQIFNRKNQTTVSNRQEKPESECNQHLSLTFQACLLEMRTRFGRDKQLFCNATGLTSIDRNMINRSGQNTTHTYYASLFFD